MRRFHPAIVALVCLATVACDEGPTEVPSPDLGPSFAAAGGVLHSVRGSGHIAQGENDRRVFSFSARQSTDGDVSGQFSLLITQSVLGSENPSITRIEAEVTCMAVAGNIAWVGGVVKNASNPGWVGGETGWAVQDNGEGANGFDLISLMNVPGPPGLAQSVCDSRSRIPNISVEQGNIQVSSGGPVNDNHFPFNTVIPVCGEWVAFTGSFHPTSSFRADGAGGFHFRGHINATGIGVSLESDHVFNWNDAINYSESFRGMQATFTSQQSFNLIGRGQAPNQRMHMNTHVTVTPDGVVKVTADNFRFDCSTDGPV